MSFKNSAKGKLTNEVMTRQKRKLLEKQLHSTKGKTQQNLDEVKNTPAKAVISRTKSSRKKRKPITKEENTETKTEFHPEKLKRTIKAKKIFLKPKYNMKPIVNKRKFCLPQKDLNSTLAKRLKNETAKGLSMHELIQLKEDRGLDEEEFHEILTCESPVWWEHPSDNQHPTDIPPKTDIEDSCEVSNCLEHEKRRTVEDACFNNNNVALRNMLNLGEDSFLIEFTGGVNCLSSFDIITSEVDRQENTLNREENIKNLTTCKLSMAQQEDNSVNRLSSEVVPFDDKESLKSIEIEERCSIDDIIVLDDSSQDSMKFKSNIEMPQIVTEPLNSSTTKVETITIKKPDKSVETYYLEDVSLTINSPSNSDYAELIKKSQQSSFVIKSIEKDSEISPITIQSDDSLDSISIASDYCINEHDDCTISDAHIKYISIDSSHQNKNIESDNSKELPSGSKEPVACKTLKSEGGIRTNLTSFFRKCKNIGSIKPDDKTK